MAGMWSWEPRGTGDRWLSVLVGGHRSCKNTGTWSFHKWRWAGTCYLQTHRKTPPRHTHTQSTPTVPSHPNPAFVPGCRKDASPSCAFIWRKHRWAQRPYLRTPHRKWLWTGLLSGQSCLIPKLNNLAESAAGCVCGVVIETPWLSPSLY